MTTVQQTTDNNPPAEPSPVNIDRAGTGSGEPRHYRYEAGAPVVGPWTWPSFIYKGRRRAPTGGASILTSAYWLFKRRRQVTR